MTLPTLHLISGRRLICWLEDILALRRPVPVKVAVRHRLASARRSSALILALGFATVLAHSSAATAQTPCGPRDQLVRLLSEQYKETPVGIGLAQTGQVLEVFASLAGSWSMVMTTPDGKACLIASGDNWEMVARVKGTAI